MTTADFNVLHSFGTSSTVIYLYAMGDYDILCSAEVVSSLIGVRVLAQQGSVSRKSLSLEMDLRSLITIVTIVFSMLKITRGLEIFLRNWPQKT